jgi:hypothetical protein
MDRELPEQEPVAWMLITPYGEEDDIVYTEPEIVPDGWSYKPLYDTAPTPRKPLTDDEIAQAMFRAHAIVTGPMQFRFAREIERAHGIVEQKEKEWK